MNAIQKEIQKIVLELIQAQVDYVKLKRKNPPGSFEDLIELKNEIQDGRFFRLPRDIQYNTLFCLKIAFFGRGERAIPLFIEGLLPEDFETRFRDLYTKYRDSQGLQ